MKGIFTIRQTGDRSNGGVESITQILQHLPGKEHIIITQKETATNAKWKGYGYTVFTWKPGSVLLDTILTNIRMYRLLKKEKIQFIHCNDTYFFWKIIIAAKLASVKLAINIRDTKAAHQTYGRQWKYIFKLSRKIIFLSKDMQETVYSRVFGNTNMASLGDKMEYIYSIVDGNRFKAATQQEKQELRAKHNINKDAFVMVYVATFNVKKAQLEFLKNCLPFFKNANNVELHFVGDFEVAESEYAAACNEIVEKGGAGNKIFFHGFNNTIENWYRLADAGILASQREGLARCMIECICCGTPFISFDVASAKEILETYNCGFVVKQGDYKTFTESINKFVHDSGLKAEMGANGYDAGKKIFITEKIIDRYLSVYKNLSFD
jgi:glycosyltransferase involved in cell wall biosynthesis